MNTLRHLTALAVISAAISTSAFAAPKVLGKWNGHVTIDTKKILSQMPATMDAKAKANVVEMMKKTSKMLILLNLKANNTYTVDVSGAPGGQKPEQDGGTWTLSGSTLSLKGKKGNPQAATVAKDGKSITIVAPGGQGTVVFKR